MAKERLRGKLLDDHMRLRSEANAITENLPGSLKLLKQAFSTRSLSSWRRPLALPSPFIPSLGERRDILLKVLLHVAKG
jgi:hypothetical protein